MTETNNGELHPQLNALKRRVRRLEAGRTWQWLFIAAILTGMIFPIAVSTYEHYVLDLSAETNEFQGRFEYRSDETDGPKYVLILKNTGTRKAADLIGTASVEFPSPITAIDRKKALPNTTYRSNGTEDPKACLGATTCAMGWGGLEPGGVMAIAFVTPDAPAALPEAHYGGNEITSWSCARLTTIAKALCVDNELGFTIDAP